MIKNEPWLVYGYVDKKSGALALVPFFLTWSEAQARKDWMELCTGLKLKVVKLRVTRHSVV